MDQQISPGASSQTASTALQTANGQGKSTGKGVFAKLLAIFEGKANKDSGAGSEQTFKNSENATVSSPVTSIADKADANVLLVGKSAVQKIKPEQKESSDIVMADTDIETQYDSHPKPKLIAANKQVELNTQSIAGTGNIATTVKADVNQPTKTGVRAGAAPAAINHGADVKAVATTVKADVNQPTKTGVRAGAAPAPINHGADVKAVAATVKADVSQSAKAGARIDASPAAVNHGIDVKEVTGGKADAIPAATNQGVDVKDVVATVKADVNQPAKAGARVGAIPAAASAADIEGTTAILGKVSNPASTARNEQQINANEQRTAGIKATMQQVASSTMQPEKTSFIQAEANIVPSLPEQHRLSTNKFVKNRKVNLDHASKTKTPLLQARADKKPELLAGQHRQPPMQASESFSNSMRDVMVQPETFSRSGRQSFDFANAQAFQTNGLDPASTPMRAVFQPHQTMLSSGPWPVAAAMQQIGHAAGQGKFQLELTLTPANLGKVQVFLESDVNKQIQVHLIVDQAASRQSIEQHLPALRQALADQGLNMDSFTMESSEQNKDNQQGRQNRHAPSSTATTGISSPGENQVGTAANGRLSIRV